MNKYEKRIEIAKKAVKNIRLEKGYALKIIQPSLVTTTPREWAIGVIGILDYIKTGSIDMILLHEVREEAKKIVANDETNRNNSTREQK